MANSETKKLYEIGGAYYYDDTGAKRASADDQAAYLTNQAKSDPNNVSMADLGWANSSGGWVDYTDDDDRDYMGSNGPHKSYDNTKAKYTDTGKPILDTTWTGRSGGLYKLPDGNSVKYDGTTVGLIAALNKYYGEGGWSDGKPPDIYPTLSTKPVTGRMPTSPGLYLDPNDGLTYGYTLDKSGNKVWGTAGNEWAYPEDDMSGGGGAMTWSQAVARAGRQLNPIYDAQRDRQEVAASQNREILPQLMAARYGMSGTKGGRIGSQMTKSVQAEGSAINAIEGERTRGINELAQGLYEQDQARVQREMQLQAEQERIAQGWAQINNAQANANADRKMAYDFRYLDEERFLKTYGLSKDELAYRMTSGDRDYQLALDELGLNKERFAWEKDPSNLDNVYKQAQIRNLLSGGGGGYGGYGGSGGSGGGDLTANQADQSKQAATKWVTAQVENDDRLLPDRSNYWVLADAWKKMYMQMTYGE